MARFAAQAVVAVVLVIPWSIAAEELPRAVVMNFAVEKGIDESTVRLLNDVMLSEFQNTGKFHVFGEQDIVSIMDLERTKIQTKGCADDACLAEIGGALGAQYLASSRVGKLGEKFVLNLKMIEVPIPYSERQGRSKLNVMRDGMRFAQSIVWTALTYNPVRLLGLIGLAALAVTLAVGLWILVQRLQGITTLGPWGVFALFSAAVLGVAGVSIFTLGATFNYLVAIFYKQPIRQGLFGRPLFSPPLDRHFWWMGLVGMVGGVGLAAASLVLSLNGWPMTRLWFWELLAAMSALVGLQLLVSWFIMRALEELSQREVRVAEDLQNDPPWMSC